ncbi:uncharacterized protein LOC142166245 [Nicotiana tabacum]|uniref:Uncharacterized protein LOC142166245 n=1 Tax=Nicotiana tabacum TaxID=4097 RepID=A0AC58S7V3_TOBAC
MRENIIRWNIRGLNDESKRSTIKALIQKWKLDILCLQETKTQTCSMAIARQIRDSRWVEWTELKASGNRGWARGENSLHASRIDRFLISSEWNDLFGSVQQLALPRVVSDHRPIALESGDWTSEPSYLKFENMWLQHEGFCDMTKEWWQGYMVNGSPDFLLPQKLKLLKKDLAIWNWESYGKISTRPNKDILQVGEDIIEEKEQIKRVILDFYQDLYSENETWRPSCTFEGLGCLNNEEKDALEVAFEEEEVLDAINSCAPDKSPGPNNFTLAFYQRCWDTVKLDDAPCNFYVLDAINSCAPDKSPGPDGFTLAFYQRCWDTVKLDVMGTFNHFQRNCHMVKSFNASFIALIPKSKGAIELKDFRPISLTSSVYKIVAKVLTRDLKRQITDVALIANEVLDWRQQNGEHGVLFKLDIEKTFDKINWQSPAGFSSPERGIRQGDSLSPFLFILAMEGLSIMVEKAKQMHWMQGFDVGNNSSLTVLVCHLLFADDTLIFCGAEKSQIKYLNLTLLIFEALSGMHINMSKSVIYHVNVIPELEMLKAKATESLLFELSLGASISRGSFEALGNFDASRLLGSCGSFVLYCCPFNCRLKAKATESLLFKLSLGASIAGVLSKLLGTLTHRGYWVLVDLLFFIVVRLTGNNKNRKFHLVKWAKVTLPKSLRGLRVKDLALHSKSMLNGIGGIIRKELVSGRRLFKLNMAVKITGVPILLDLTMDMGCGRNWEVNSWNPSLRRNLNDWEFDDLVALLGSLHNSSTITPGRDKLRWGSSRSGAYSVRASYQTLSFRKEMIDQLPWKLIWRTKMPPKVSVFCWITLNGACLTHDKLIRRGFQLASRFHMCQSNSETINHLFLHCPVVTDIWSMFLSLFEFRWTMPCSVKEVFVSWSSWKVEKSIKKIWSMVSAAILWCLWTEKNQRCFDGISSTGYLLSEGDGFTISFCWSLTYSEVKNGGAMVLRLKRVKVEDERERERDNRYGALVLHHETFLRYRDELSQLEAEVKELAEKRDMYKLLSEQREGEIKNLRDELDAAQKEHAALVEQVKNFEVSDDELCMANNGQNPQVQQKLDRINQLRAEMDKVKAMAEV